jgi:hypothetical protein
MVGLLLSPAKAKGYKKLGIAYDGVQKREENWKMAQDFRNRFLNDPTPNTATLFAEAASKMGYFSIWMDVFHDQPTMRKELIRAFKADPDCFDSVTTAPVRKGRL